MNKALGMIGICAIMASAQASVAWKNIDDEHYRAGRKASVGYMQGKVVLVDRWGVGCPPCRALLPRLEQVWQSFKSKQLVVIGGHCPGWGDAAGIKRLADENKLTYSIYEDAGLAQGEPEFNAIPFLYVVDATGVIVYHGHDERRATEAVVTALTDLESPKSIAQWKRFLDFEFENLPGHAYNRYVEFTKKHPQEAKAYEAKFRELAAKPDIKKLAALVTFAKQARDTGDFDAKHKADKSKFAAKVKTAIDKAIPLTKNDDPKFVQEAKNSIADLKWAKAAL